MIETCGLELSLTNENELRYLNSLTFIIAYESNEDVSSSEISPDFEEEDIFYLEDDSNDKRRSLHDSIPVSDLWDLSFNKKEIEKEKCLSIAKKMKKDGLDIDAIKKYTSLSKKDIKKL